MNFSIVDIISQNYIADLVYVCGLYLSESFASESSMAQQ